MTTTALLITASVLLSLIIAAAAIPKIADFVHAFYTRLTQVTPPFFRKLTRICLSIGTFGMLVQPDVARLIQTLISLEYEVPKWLADIGEYALIAGLVGSIFSRLPVDEAKVNDDTYNRIK